MKYLLLLALLAVASCDVQSEPQGRKYAGEIRYTENVGGDRNTIRFYDSEMKVWCWKTGANQGGISCIPEWTLEDPYGKFTTEEQRRIMQQDGQ